MASVLSSNFDLFISPKVCFAGEVGLSGEIRPVPQVERRIAEAAKLGFEEIYVSSFSRAEALKPRSGNIRIVSIPDIPALCRKLFQ